MSVIDVKEHFEGRSGEINLDGVRTYIRSYNVRTDDASDCGPTIFNATGIPVLGAVFPSDLWAYCIKKSCRQGEDRNWWQVTVDYSTKLPIDPLEANENPLLRAPQLRISTNKFTKTLVEDFVGAKLLNSAGDPFEGGYEVTDSRPVISITWNKAAAGFSPVAFAGYNNKTNNDTYRGFPPETLYVADAGCEFQFENNVAFYRCSIQLEYNAGKWNPVKMLDEGYRELNDDDEPVNIRLADNSLATTPALLDGSGHKLAVGGTPVFREFTLYEATSFAAFP